MEVLIAMVILASSVGVALLVYVKVLESNTTQKKLFAYKSMERFVEESKTEARYFDEEQPFTYGTLIKQVEVSENELILFRVEAVDEAGNILVKRNYYHIANE